MSTLSAFFAQNVAMETTEDVIVSERFKDEQGNPIPWKLQAISEDQNDALRKAATKRVKGRGGQHVTETDQTEYLARLAAASVVFPNLKDGELQNSYGVRGAEVLIRRMLLAGEYANLLLKVQEINGFDNDINELVEEAKN
ncbi:phage portal protein [Paenibacillus sp. TAB 01]|uniref:phage tail assembly chaperone n=1 Tax=Paenibacillus sp. TAB 01 TaxID=3368988 RepID=UPI00375149E8